MAMLPEKNTILPEIFSQKGKRLLQKADKKLVHEKYVLEKKLTVLLNHDHTMNVVEVVVNYIDTYK